MTPPPCASGVAHFFTVDVEEYFQVSAFDAVLSRDEWTSRPLRLDRTVPVLLDRLSRHGARGTFFTLGWVARHEPSIVKSIAAAGHEIASHGFWHRRVNALAPAEFREDLRASKRELEDVVGAAVVGYRAPSFSISPGVEWAFDILLEEGFTYDSSVFPIRRRGYGYPGAERAPHAIRRASGTLAEFPLATIRIGGVSLPAAGGGYLRQLPFGIVQRAFRDAKNAGVAATFYIHPWEIDPAQPRLRVGFLTRMRHYRGLTNTLARIDGLLDEFSFTAIASRLEAMRESLPVSAVISSR